MGNSSRLHLLSNESRVENQYSTQDLLVFVGGKQSFSNAFLRTISAEFAELEPVRVASIREFAEFLKVTDACPRLVVVDAPLCAEFARLRGGTDDGEIGAPGTNGPPVAVTYWDAASAALAQEAGGAIAQMRGYVPMSQSLDIWLSVLRLLISGGSYYPPDIERGKPVGRGGGSPMPQSEGAAGIAGKSDPHSAHPVGQLTPREQEVMQLVVTGMQNKQIAGALKLSSHTVKLHMHHIIAKLGASNRTEAAIRYLAERSD